jgi:uncharacterized HAD superfamily protein
MMIIGLDIDGVISDIVARLNDELASRSYDDYDYSNWLCTIHNCGLSDEIFSNPLFWKNLKPFNDAWHQVNYWWSEGHEIHLVTSRRSAVSIDCLDDWLGSWGVSYDRFHVSKMGSKCEILKELNVDFMIEDNPNEVLLVEENGIKCFLRRAWYNIDYWDSLDSIGSLYDLKIINNKVVKI